MIRQSPTAAGTKFAGRSADVSCADQRMDQNAGTILRPWSGHRFRPNSNGVRQVRATSILHHVLRIRMQEVTDGSDYRSGTASDKAYGG